MQFPYPHMDYSPRLGPFLLGPNDEPENGVYGGDFFSYAHLIPDNSIDLCFTDPVYWQIDDYRRLAEVCARVLKPDGALLVWLGLATLPEIIKSMSNSGLIYRWFIAHQMNGYQAAWFRDRVFRRWQGCLWYSKEEAAAGKWKPDVIVTTNGSKGWHEWGKQWHATIKLISWFSSEKSTILDPFTGGGTVPAVCKQLGRRYLAFEIDRDTAQLARQRVRDTQPPLFVLQPEQTRLPDPEVA